MFLSHTIVLSCSKSDNEVWASFVSVRKRLRHRILLIDNFASLALASWVRAAAPALQPHYSHIYVPTYCWPLRNTTVQTCLGKKKPHRHGRKPNPRFPGKATLPHLRHLDDWSPPHYASGRGTANTSIRAPKLPPRAWDVCTAMGEIGHSARISSSKSMDDKVASRTG